MRRQLWLSDVCSLLTPDACKLCLFPKVWRWFSLCLPPAYPANPAENHIEADTADCRMFQQCTTDALESSSLVGPVAVPEKITQEVGIRKPQEAVDLVYRFCVTQREALCWYKCSESGQYHQNNMW